MWDTTQYFRVADERFRSFVDLVARVGADWPGYVVEIGRGPADAAGAIADDHAPGLSFMRDDVRHWKPQAMPDGTHRPSSAASSR